MHAGFAFPFRQQANLVVAMKALNPFKHIPGLYDEEADLWYEAPNKSLHFVPADSEELHHDKAIYKALSLASHSASMLYSADVRGRMCSAHQTPHIAGFVIVTSPSRNLSRCFFAKVIVADWRLSCR